MRSGTIEKVAGRHRPLYGFALLAVAVLALAWWKYDSFQFGTWVDDAKYYLLARALIRGEPYGLHIGPVDVPTAFPFVFPLTLVPFVALVPEQLDAGRLVSLLATLANVALLFLGWRFLSGLRSRWWALAAAAAYGLFPAVLGFAHVIMSEPLFTAFALLALIASEWCARDREPRLGRHVLLGLATSAAFYTRSAGVAVVAAVLLRLCWRRGLRVWRPLAAVFAGTLLLVLPVVVLTPVRSDDLVPWLYLVKVPRPLSQGEAEAPFGEQLWTSAREYSTKILRDSIVPVGGGIREQQFADRIGLPHLPTAVNLTVTALILLGFLASPRGALRPTVVLYEIFYLAVAFLWHVRTSRLLYPVMPLLFLQLLWGIRAVASWLLLRLPRSAHRGTVISPRTAVILCAVALIAASVASHFRDRWRPEVRFVRDFVVDTEWLRRNSAPDATVLADEPFQVHLYSGRPVVPEWEVTTVEDLRRLGIRFILIAPILEWSADGSRRYDERTRRVMLPMIDSLTAEGLLTLVYESPPGELVRLYRLEAAPGQADQG